MYSTYTHIQPPSQHHNTTSIYTLYIHNFPKPTYFMEIATKYNNPLQTQIALLNIRPVLPFPLHTQPNPE